MKQSMSILQLGVTLTHHALPPLTRSNWVAWSGLVEDLLSNYPHALAHLQPTYDGIIDGDFDRQLFSFIHLHVDPSLRHLLQSARDAYGRSGRKAFQLIKSHLCIQHPRIKNYSNQREVIGVGVETEHQLSDLASSPSRKKQELLEAQVQEALEGSLVENGDKGDSDDSTKQLVWPLFSAEEGAGSWADMVASEEAEEGNDPAKEERTGRQIEAIESRERKLQTPATPPSKDASGRDVFKEGHPDVTRDSPMVKEPSSLDTTTSKAASMPLKPINISVTGKHTERSTNCKPPTPQPRSVLDIRTDRIPELGLDNWLDWNAVICGVLAPYEKALNILTGKIDMIENPSYDRTIDRELLAFISPLISPFHRKMLLSLDAGRDYHKGSKAYAHLRQYMTNHKRQQVRKSLASLRQGEKSLVEYYEETQEVYWEAYQYGIYFYEKDKVEHFVEGLSESLKEDPAIQDLLQDSRRQGDSTLKLFYCTIQDALQKSDNSAVPCKASQEASSTTPSSPILPLPSPTGPSKRPKSVANLKMVGSMSFNLDYWYHWRASICELVAPCGNALDILIGRVREGDALYDEVVDFDLWTLLYRLASVDSRRKIALLDTSNTSKGSWTFQAIDQAFLSCREEVEREIEVMSQGPLLAVDAYYGIAKELYERAYLYQLFYTEESKIELFINGLAPTYKSMAEEIQRVEPNFTLYDLFTKLQE